MKSKEERREIALKALQPGANYAEIGREHGVSRQAVWNYLDSVLDDPEGRLEAAEEEVEFRREVLRLVG